MKRSFKRFMRAGAFCVGLHLNNRVPLRLQGGPQEQKGTTLKPAKHVITRH